MSDTSRLDSVYAAWRESGIGGVFSPVALCRELERDLSALRKENEALVVALNGIIDYAHEWQAMTDQGRREHEEAIETARALLAKEERHE